jgi:hypothetical protein
MDVDFYSLERPVQDRFADATRSIGLPAPILREPPRDFRAAMWFAGSAVSVAVLVVLIVRGFGNLASPVAIAPVVHAIGYAGVASLAIFCALMGVAIQSERARIPYRPGLYLFPAGIIDARAEPLRVFRQEQLRECTVTDGARVEVRVDGAGPFVFSVPQAGLAEQVKGVLEQARTQYEQAKKAENRRELAMLDPLVDSGFSSPFSPKAPIVRQRPLWTKLVPLCAVAAGTALGFGLWKVRNVASEQLLYRAARSRDDVEAYQAYLARGGPRTDVSEILLPRAELRNAVGAGTVEALEAFEAAHPGSRIQAELDLAVRAALDKELAAARAAGTATALRTFQSRRARYAFMKPASEAALVELYRRALDQFSKGKEAQIKSFFERLLGYAKAHGPKVELRFVRRLPESVDRADAQVKASAYFMGKQSIPSQYFAGDYAERRETAAAAALAEALNSPFPADMLRLEPVPTWTEDGTPELTAPALVVEYFPEMAGGYMSPKPRGVFVGVGMMYRASMQIPGDSAPLEYKFSLWRIPNPHILEAEGTTVADVYEKMAGDAFDKFVKGFVTFVMGSGKTEGQATADKN